MWLLYYGAHPSRASVWVVQLVEQRTRHLQFQKFKLHYCLFFLFFFYIFRFNNVKYLQHHPVLFYVLVRKKTKDCRIFLFCLFDVAFRNMRRLTCTSYFCSKCLLVFIILLTSEYHSDKNNCRRLVNINNLRKSDFPGTGLEEE